MDILIIIEEIRQLLSTASESDIRFIYHWLTT